MGHLFHGKIVPSGNSSIEQYVDCRFKGQFFTVTQVSWAKSFVGLSFLGHIIVRLKSCKKNKLSKVFSYRNSPSKSTHPCRSTCVAIHEMDIVSENFD